MSLGFSEPVDQPGGDDAANSAGATSVFERDELGSWIEADILHTDDQAGSDSFGVRVAIDGDTVIVGAHANDDDGDNSGSAYLFQPDLAVPGSWLEVDLAQPSLLAIFPADENGEISLSPTAPSTACGRLLQAIDLTRCLVSKLSAIPSENPRRPATGDRLEFAHSDGISILPLISSVAVVGMAVLRTALNHTPKS